MFAAGGIGSVGAPSCWASAGCRGATSRSCTSWTLATLAVAGYGLATAVWQLMLASLRSTARDGRARSCGDGEAAPRARALLGRVSSLDWLISIGLLPLSFALTGPVAAAIGARTTLVARRACSAAP